MVAILCDSMERSISFEIELSSSISNDMESDAWL